MSTNVMEVSAAVENCPCPNAESGVSQCSFQIEQSDVCRVKIKGNEDQYKKITEVKIKNVGRYGAVAEYAVFINDYTDIKKRGELERDEVAIVRHYGKTDQTYWLQQHNPQPGSKYLLMEYKIEVKPYPPQ